jgi:glycerol-3-phosphate acyltransferase PlsX
VTEGFTGNIALKTAEGTARQIMTVLREAMNESWMSRLGYLFARKAFAKVRDKLDPRRSNGGVFLGLDGIVIKSHGGTDALGFCRAIEIGNSMVRRGLQTRIRESLTQSQELRLAAGHPPAPADAGAGA